MSDTKTLFKHVEKGDFAEVKQFIAAGGDVNSSNHFKENLLFLACANGHLDMAIFLIENHADIYALNSAKHSILNAACLGGNVEIVKKLLYLDKNDPEHKLIKTLRLDYGFYPKNFPVFEYLFDQGFVKDSDIDNLKIIKYEGEPELIKLLNLIWTRFPREKFVDQLIGVAIAYRDLNALESMLIKFPKASTKLPKYFREFMDDLSIDYPSDQQISSFQFLLTKGLSFETQNKKGQTLLHYAAGFYEYNEFEDFEQIEALISMGYPLNVLNKKGQTPLHTALENGYLYQALSLIEAGADVNQPDEKGKTPLDYVATFSHPNFEKDDEFIVESKEQLLKAIEEVRSR